MFCALAAFTKDFEIGYKLVSDKEETAATVVQQQDGFSLSEIDAFRSRSEKLPLLNARGISTVMMLSRVLLLFQYLISECLFTSINSVELK